MKSYEDFRLELVCCLRGQYPSASITSREVFKTNVKRQGIGIDEGEGVEAMIYPQELYPLYQAVQDMDVVLRVVDARIDFEKIQGYKQMLNDWESIRQYVRPFVINREKNREFLKKYEYIYQEKLDLAYGCCVEFPKSDKGDSGTVRIPKGMLSQWNLSEEEVFRVAEANAAYEIKSVWQKIAETLGAQEIDETDEADEEVCDKDYMLVLTTPTGVFGASGMFDTKVLHKKAEELQSNFYILPSSVHEVILLKEKEAPSVESLKQSVYGINQTIIPEDEVLSDSIYYYDREKNEVKIVG